MLLRLSTPNESTRPIAMAAMITTPGDTGWHDRGQQEVRDDQAEEQLRIAVADTAHHHIGQALERAPICCPSIRSRSRRTGTRPTCRRNPRTPSRTSRCRTSRRENSRGCRRCRDRAPGSSNWGNHEHPDRQRAMRERRDRPAAGVGNRRTRPQSPAGRSGSSGRTACLS